jgi:hypothetical protein
MPMRALATKVDMKLIKELREMTGAPMADCKKAITESLESEDVRLPPLHTTLVMSSTSQRPSHPRFSTPPSPGCASLVPPLTSPHLSPYLPPDCGSLRSSLADRDDCLQARTRWPRRPAAKPRRASWRSMLRATKAWCEHLLVLALLLETRPFRITRSRLPPLLDGRAEQ